MSVGTDSSKEVCLCTVNYNSDAAGNATTSRIDEVDGSSSKDKFLCVTKGLWDIFEITPPRQTNLELHQAKVLAGKHQAIQKHG